MKSVLLLGLLVNNTAFSQYFVSLPKSHHLISRGLNEDHPQAGYETKKFGGTIYKNSFGKAGVAIYHINSLVKTDRWSINLKSGVTTGYNKTMSYNGVDTNLKMLWLVNGVAALIVPSIEFKISKTHYIHYDQLGEAVAVGLKARFN